MNRALALACLFIAAFVVYFVVGDDTDPTRAPDLCGLAGAPACNVDSPPCAAAGDRDLNSADRAVDPAGGLRLRASGSASLPYGFNDPAVAIGQLTAEQDLRVHTSVGSTMVRVVLDWGAVEPRPNEFDFAAVDALYCVATTAGVQPLYTLTGVPPWALDESANPCSGSPCVQPPGEDSLAGLERFSELAAIRYPDAAAFEAWNEPNFSTFWPEPDPARYARLLEAVYDGVKSGNPEMTVLGGSVTNTPNDDPANGTLSMSNFLDAMFEAGAAEHMDALSIHAYPIGPLGGSDDLFTPQIAEARRLANKASGERTMALWVTETGIPTEDGGFAPAVDETEQAQQLGGLYQQLSALPDVDAVLFHTLVDPTSAVPGGPGFGWFKEPSGTTIEAKPIVCVFRALSNLAGCPATVDLG